jgi:hypothetical protein
MTRLRRNRPGLDVPAPAPSSLAAGNIAAVDHRDVRGRAEEADGRWTGRLLPDGRRLSAPTRERMLARLRDEAGEGASLTVELEPALVGVAEAASILGWDKRRVVTYVERGSFPEPVARLASGRVWRREDVEAFARAFRRRLALRERRRAGT